MSLLKAPPLFPQSERIQKDPHVFYGNQFSCEPSRMLWHLRRSSTLLPTPLNTVLPLKGFSSYLSGGDLLPFFPTTIDFFCACGTLFFPPPPGTKNPRERGPAAGQVTIVCPCLIAGPLACLLRGDFFSEMFVLGWADLMRKRRIVDEPAGALDVACVLLFFRSVFLQLIDDS